MRWLWVVTVSSVVMVLVGCAETNAPTGTLPPPSITITPDYEAKVDVDVQATGQAIMASTVPPTPTPTPPPSPPTSTPGTVPITPTVFATLTPSPTILYEPTPAATSPTLSATIPTRIPPPTPTQIPILSPPTPASTSSRSPTPVIVPVLTPAPGMISGPFGLSRPEVQGLIHLGIKAAMDNLQQRLGDELRSAQIVRIEEAIWRDTSLGCPGPGVVYAQVMTQGIWMVLSHRGQESDYRISNSQACRPSAIMGQERG